MAENTLSFIEKIVNAILKKRFDNENLMRVKPAVVIGCDEKSGKTSVYMLDDNTKKPYNFLNKTGEILVEGDNVKVYYTKNIAKGYIGMRVGLANVIKATGVGRASEFDETSEYFNSYEGSYKNIAGVAGKKSFATAKGFGTEAAGFASFAAGQRTKAKGDNSVAFGHSTEVNGNFSFGCGLENKIESPWSFGFGHYNNISGESSGCVGYHNSVKGSWNYAFGYTNTISGQSSFVEGQTNELANVHSTHCSGQQNKVNNSQYCAVSGGWNEVNNNTMASLVSGMFNSTLQTESSVIAGQNNKVEYGKGVFVGGYYNEIIPPEGQANQTYSSGAMGQGNKLINGSNYSYAFGLYNELTKSNYSFVSGMFNKTNGVQSTSVFGMYNEINNTQYCTANGAYLKLLEGSAGVAAFGQYNNPLADYVFMIGNGTGDSSRSNAFAVTRDGVVICKSVAQLGDDGTTVELHDTHLDLSAVSLEKSFTWSADSYPNSTDPNLNGKPVLVLSVVGGENVAYKFIDMSMFVYDKQDTQTAETILTDNKFSVNVKISAEDKNVLVKKEDGLYASIPNTAVSSEIGNIIQEKEDGLFAANRKIKLINHEPTAADLEGEECIIMQYDSTNDIVGANTTLHKITGLFYEN